MLHRKGQKDLIKKLEKYEGKIFDITTSRKLLVGGIATGIITAVSLVSVTFYNFYYFVDKNTVVIQSPIVLKLQPPVVISKRITNVIGPVVESTLSASITPTMPATLTDEQIVKANPHGDVLWKIYALESSRGKNDYCRNSNKGFGGFGVLDRGKIVCYETFEKAVERAEYWLIKNGVDRNLAVALCRWNEGKSIDNCYYYTNYLIIN